MLTYITTSKRQIYRKSLQVYPPSTYAYFHHRTVSGKSHFTACVSICICRHVTPAPHHHKANNTLVSRRGVSYTYSHWSSHESLSSGKVWLGVNINCHTKGLLCGSVRWWRSRRGRYTLHVKDKGTQADVWTINVVNVVNVVHLDEA